MPTINLNHNSELSKFISSLKAVLPYFDPNLNLLILDTNLFLRYYNGSYHKVLEFKIGENIFSKLQSNSLCNILEYDKQKIYSAIRQTLNGIQQDTISFYATPCNIATKMVIKLLPIYETNRVIGIIAFLAQDNNFMNIINHPDTRCHLDRNTGIEHSLSKKIHNTTKLTKRERHVIFLLINKYTSREIAEILSRIEDKIIVKDSIDKTIRTQIMKKFNCLNRTTLINKLLNLGYHTMMPDIFIQPSKNEPHLYTQTEKSELTQFPRDKFIS